MPVYNTEESDLRQAIESILCQTYTDFEFIIINDASTNNAEDVILSYNDKRIKYYKNKKNLKLIATANHLLDEAKYEYIARLDSDDWCTPDRLEKQVKYLDENEDVGVLGSFYKNMPDGTTYSIPSNPNETTIFSRYCGGCICNSSTMIRKSILDKYNIRYNEGALHAEDMKLWSDISEHCKLANYPEILTFYRISPNGISSQNRQHQAKMSSLILFENIIKDFANDLDFMYMILEKFIKEEPITDEEFVYTQSFLIGIVNFLQRQLSYPFNTYVKKCILSRLSYFVRK